MEDIKAKTTEKAENSNAFFNGADAGTVASAGTSVPNEDSLNPSEFTDSANDDARGERAGFEKSAQTKEQNRENARRRREAEKEKLIRETREQTIIEALDGRNPYTGEEMKDSLDVEEYLAMKEIEKSGGDPVVDYSRYRKNRERTDAQRALRESEREEWYRQDREHFLASHPDVDLEELIVDERFRSFAEGKVGAVPLTEIYSAYRRLIDGYEEDARSMATRMIANQKASPGALSSSQSPESGYYTRDEVKKMSPLQVRENYEKIRTSMTKWK